MKRLLLLAAMQSAILVGAQTRSDGHLFTRISRPKTISQLIGLLQMPIMTVRHGNISMRPLSPDADGGTGLAKYLYERKQCSR